MLRKKPSLLHKDYHTSHIFADKKKITGIIDVEWAIAGHTENDFIKMELWHSKICQKQRDHFFKGYLKNGHISDDYSDRKKLYEMWHWINMINISYEIKNDSCLNSI
jgi:aminoglycoside phosphotransferase (APT) family kinase protein